MTSKMDFYLEQMLMVLNMTPRLVMRDRAILQVGSDSKVGQLEVQILIGIQLGK